jgi:hypothetical protein
MCLVPAKRQGTIRVKFLHMQSGPPPTPKLLAAHPLLRDNQARKICALSSTVEHYLHTLKKVFLAISCDFLHIVYFHCKSFKQSQITSNDV